MALRTRAAEMVARGALTSSELRAAPVHSGWATVPPEEPRERWKSVLRKRGTGMKYIVLYDNNIRQNWELPRVSPSCHILRSCLTQLYQYADRLPSRAGVNGGFISIIPPSGSSMVRPKLFGTGSKSIVGSSSPTCFHWNVQQSSPPTEKR